MRVMSGRVGAGEGLQRLLQAELVRNVWEDGEKAGVTHLPSLSPRPPLSCGPVCAGDS